MKVTLENINDIKYFASINFCVEYCQNLLGSLLIDIDNINNQLKEYKHIYIDYINEHTEYSPERTDPCTDFYGMFILRFENSSDTIGIPVDLDTLDTIICTLSNFVEYEN